MMQFGDDQELTAVVQIVLPFVNLVAAILCRFWFVKDCYYPVFKLIIIEHHLLNPIKITST